MHVFLNIPNSTLLTTQAGRARMAGALALAASLAACGGSTSSVVAPPPPPAPAPAPAPTQAQLDEGKQIFRFDTFGDDRKWTDELRLNEAIEKVDPLTALAVGLKVDVDALPPEVVKGIVDKSISLTSTDTTMALIKLNALIGVKGTVELVDGKQRLTRVGLTCALCHSTVDDSFVHGVGKRLDGWANRDLNPGAIATLSPTMSAAEKLIYNSWGPGKFDTRYVMDGKNTPQVIPPAYGLQGINKITFAGDGDELAYWNSLVAVVELGGQGHFKDARINLDVTHGSQDLVTSKLQTLAYYQLSIPAPTPKAGSFDVAAADRGKAIFNGKANCASCHSGASFTDANLRLHPASDSMGEPEPNGGVAFSTRSATKQYRTTPLKGIWQHAPYFHNGSAATLDDVVQRYNTRQSLKLTTAEMADLVQFLKSI